VPYGSEGPLSTGPGPAQPSIEPSSPSPYERQAHCGLADPLSARGPGNLRPACALKPPACAGDTFFAGTPNHLIKTIPRISRKEVTRHNSYGHTANRKIG
jgi:hypothetical protein